MTDRERIIPHQLYAQEAIDSLEVFTNESYNVGKARTMFNNIPMPYNLRNSDESLLVFTRTDFEQERRRIIILIEEAKEDALKAERELDRYKTIHGELPEEDDNGNV